MTTAIETVLEVLEAAGFQRLPRPLVVAGATFEFDAAAKGTGRSHDLVVVATGTAKSRRLMQLLSGLTRTLDQVQSRIPVSLVLVGEPPADANVSHLERHARVLPVPNPTPTADEVRSAVSVLLPLTLPSAATSALAPLDEVVATLGGTLSDEHRHLIDQARIGSHAVRRALREYIDIGAQGDSNEEAQR